MCIPPSHYVHNNMITPTKVHIITLSIWHKFWAYSILLLITHNYFYSRCQKLSEDAVSTFLMQQIRVKKYECAHQEDNRLLIINFYNCIRPRTAHASATRIVIYFLLPDTIDIIVLTWMWNACVYGGYPKTVTAADSNEAIVRFSSSLLKQSRSW